MVRANISLARQEIFSVRLVLAKGAECVEREKERECECMYP